jgi:hypothetical protein
MWVTANFGKVIEDCQQAIALDASNLKAYFRGAKAAASLSKWELSIKFAQDGLVVCVHGTSVASATESLTLAKRHQL